MVENLANPKISKFGGGGGISMRFFDFTLNCRFRLGKDIAPFWAQVDLMAPLFFFEKMEMRIKLVF